MRFLLAIVFLCSGAGVFADGPKGYPFVPFDQAMRTAQAENKPVFVYFGRYGCGYCEKTNKEAFASDKVKQQFIDHYVLAYVDSESGKRLRLPSGERITERELGTRYNAFVTPVFTFLDNQGKKLHRLIGVQSVETLLAAHQSVQTQFNQAK